MATKLEGSLGMPVTESSLQEQARRHLWLHFTRMGSYEEHDVPIIVRGEGCYVYDENGKRYLDGLAGLFCVAAGRAVPSLQMPPQPRRGSSATTRAGATPSSGDRARDLHRPSSRPAI